MFTCCPQCQTCFRITAAQLKVAQGKVRCGKCHGVFNAKQSLHENDPGIKTANPSHDATVKAHQPTTHQAETKRPDPTMYTAATVAAASPRHKADDSSTDKYGGGQSSQTGKVERNDHQHISLGDADASSDSIDAIFDALDEQLTSGVFNDIRGHVATPEPAIEVDIDSYFHKQLSDFSPTSDAKLASDSKSRIDKPEPDNPNDTVVSARQSAAGNKPLSEAPAKQTATRSIRSITDAPEPTSYEDTFLASLRKKTAAETQQLELNISHTPAELATQAKTAPQQLKQAIDNIIGSKARDKSEDDEPEPHMVAHDKVIDEIINDDFTIYIDDDNDLPSDLSSLHESAPEPENDLPEHADSTDDHTTDEDLIAEAEDIFEFHSSTELPDEFDDEENDVALEINSEFELTPADETDRDTAHKSADRFSFSPVEPDDSQDEINEFAFEDAAVNKADLEEDNFTDLDEIIATPVADNGDEWDRVLATPEKTEHVVPRQLRDSVDSIIDDETSLAKKLFMLFATAILIAMLVLQILIFKSTELVQRWPGLRDSMITLCDTLPCRFTGKHDLKKVNMLSRDIRVHPKNKAALLISAAMENQAGFAQPYPDILLRFTDLTGEVVAQRRFIPEEYLGKIYRPFILMPAKTPVHLTFAVLDPGNDAINFEFDFL